MFVDLIYIDDDKLIAKIGSTKDECLESVALELKSHGRSGLYPILLCNKNIIEQHLHRVRKSSLLEFRFPDGTLPITEL